MIQLRRFTKDKRSVNLPVACRHRKFQCIFVTRNLYHQSKWSRTIDIKIIHVVLFKSSGELQQVCYFGRQLRELDFIREASQRANDTTRRFGYLLINFDLKTNDVLRFHSNIVAPQPNIFNTQSSTAKETNLTNE